VVHVLAYDVVCDRRRRKVAKIAESYGQRVNDSVFECDLAPKARVRLLARLSRAIESDEDAVRLYPIGEAQVKQVATLGRMPDVVGHKAVKAV
jgi:CRISPR-associated protein Cas2